jgi:hydrogenase expression/formation protein HypC
MCLAVPGQVLTITGESALTATGRVAFSGVIKEVSFALVPEIKVGDYVLVHAGFAIAVLDELEARRSIDYLEALSAASGQPDQQT